MIPPLPFENFDPDDLGELALALRINESEYANEYPVHQHRKGQLIVALRGAVTCQVPNAWWMVPPACGVWVPAGVPHSNRATTNAQLLFLFVDNGFVELPDHCCTLSISPVLREMIFHLPELQERPELGAHRERFVRVLVEQLSMMPIEQFHLPVSENPKIHQIANALAKNPHDRRTLAEWAKLVAVSERSLARLMLHETGLTFGRWRQQLHLIVALRELANNATVQQVADDLGYESVPAFITMFKKALGRPPAQYFLEIKTVSGK